MLVRPKSKEFEIVLFCKRSLGIHTKATNVAVMGELGRYPMIINIAGQMTKFWLHVSRKHIPPFLNSVGHM